MENFKDKVVVDKAFVIPQPGVETLPLATLASVDLNGSGDLGGFLESTGELAVGGVMVYAAYQAILSALKSEAARKEGLITRAEQIKLIATTAFESGKNSAFTMILASAAVAFLPWLGWPLTALGIVGGGVMGVRIFQNFFQLLDPAQQEELRKAAADAKVKLEGIFPDEDGGMQVAPNPA